MKVTIRRSPATATPESVESLAQSIDIGEVHALLYRRDQMDLADSLTASLTPQGACAAAQRLRCLVRRAARRHLFRDYRRVLHPGDAERLGLVALWYERAGQAGCHTWAELHEDALPTARDAATPDAAGATDVAPDAVVPGEPTRVMPDWLTAPESSVWSA